MPWAAAFGRLCVETMSLQNTRLHTCAAAFGRLCVETLLLAYFQSPLIAAAFGRLCVETDLADYAAQGYERQPPSGGCVLKLII